MFGYLNPSHPFIKEHLGNSSAYTIAEKLQLLDCKPHKFIKTEKGKKTEVEIELEKIGDTEKEEKKSESSAQQNKFNFKGKGVYFKISEKGDKEGYTVLFEKKVAIGWELIVGGVHHRGGRQGLFTCKVSQAECKKNTPMELEELERISKLLTPKS